MEQNIKLNILKSIGEVFEQSKECKLTSSHFEKLANELTLLSEYFNTSQNQSFFIAMVFALNYKGDTVDLNDLIEYFDCNPMKLLEFSDDFEELNSRGIFEKQKSRHRMKLAGTNDQFIINEQISKAILQNKPMPELQKDKHNDIIDLLEKLFRIGETREENEFPTIVMFLKIERLLSENQHFVLIEKIQQNNYEVEDSYLYFYLIWKTLSGNKTIDVSRALEKFYDNPSERLNYMQKIVSGNHALIKADLIETEDASFFNDIEIKLTDKSYRFLNECNLKLFTARKWDNVIHPSEIPARKLIFNDVEKQQLLMLQNLLDEDNLLSVQNRLSGKGLPQGVTVLLYGEPGTGKTETVKQLAKETDRQIMKVEISKSKSMWFGQSEKLIKRIFTDYKTFAKECPQAPILLFNEADAIISKRRDIGSSNVAQTENAIQNIILEELENFEGILIATTNLANNLDSAFERRFLFKIKFRKPDDSIKAQIWKSKLPQLSLSECSLLAGDFNFSGGQIENILRKSEIHEIIHGVTITFKQIIDFCKEETLNNKRVQIGFSKQ